MAPVALPVPPLSDGPAAVPTRTEADIAAAQPLQPVLWRLAENPLVFVIDFPDLESQGRTMNRVAALVEKAGLPRDRVVTEAELVAAIGRSGETEATWYFGHDYRSSALQRFFALAERDGIPLRPEETWLRQQVQRAQAATGGPAFAVISLAGTGPRQDQVMRAAVLRHEVGHGHFFTNPAYAAHVREVWRHRFQEADRAAIRRFLGQEGYDTADEELMYNEAQAYLLFTPDDRFFSARAAGMTEAQVQRLRLLLRDGSPLAIPQ